MSITNSSASLKLKSLVTVLFRYRLCAGNLSQGSCYRGAYLSKFSRGYPAHDGMRLFSANYNGFSTKVPIKRVNVERVPPSFPPPSPKRSLATWVKWLLGCMVTLVLPLSWKEKWQNLLKIEEKVEEVVEEAEIVAEVVEKVATTAENISAEVANKLPDASKLKEAALMVEHLFTATAKDAEVTKDFIEKVEELNHDLKDLGKIVKPTTDKVIPKEQGQKQEQKHGHEHEHEQEEEREQEDGGK